MFSQDRHPIALVCPTRPWQGRLRAQDRPALLDRTAPLVRMHDTPRIGLLAQIQTQNTVTCIHVALGEILVELLAQTHLDTLRARNAHLVQIDKSSMGQRVLLCSGRDLSAECVDVTCIRVLGQGQLGRQTRSAPHAPLDPSPTLQASHSAALTHDWEVRKYDSL